jgi:hypothetical protein
MRKEKVMRPLVMVGLLAAGLMAMAGLALVLLIAAVVLAASSSAGPPADFGATAPVKFYNPGDDIVPLDLSRPSGNSPVDWGTTGAEIDGGFDAGGTIDRSGEGAHVFRSGTEVLTLPY